MYVDANNLYGWAMGKKLPVDSFKWVDDLTMFSDDFIKGYDEESDIVYLLLVDIEYPKTLRILHKPIYLGQAVLDISKTLMFEFWYDYLKPIYGDKIRLCYTDTDSFIMHIKTEDFYKDISADIDRWFDTSNFDKNDNKPLKIGKNMY